MKKVESLLPLSSRLEAEVSATVELIESSWRSDIVWRGLSGEQITGEQVIEHLAATFALLERAGWVRTWREAQTGGASNPVDDLSEASSVRQILRAAVWALKDFAGSGHGPMTFGYALHRVGDTDSWSATSKVLEMVLKSRTGADYANAASWAERRGRTWGDLRELAAVAAEVARRSGPEGVAA
ncbi:hypothetical protein [Streptomyces axinellae]|uniref:hypothetical protein n=1 Tax=Streptomyces axinellae TaxID=552788 RepID=UPI0031DF1289